MAAPAEESAAMLSSVSKFDFRPPQDEYDEPAKIVALREAAKDDLAAMSKYVAKLHRKP
jgi:hypothetical protein